MCHCCVHHWLSAPLTLNYLVGPGSVPLSLVSCHTLGSYIPLHHETIEYYWRQICEGQNKDSVEEVLRYARRPDNLQMSMTIPTNVILYIHGTQSLSTTIQNSCFSWFSFPRFFSSVSKEEG